MSPQRCTLLCCIILIHKIICQTYTTISGTWNDDYELSPPQGWSLQYDGVDYAYSIENSTDTGKIYHLLSANGFINLTQSFYCNAPSAVQILFDVFYCDTESDDYLRLYLNDDLKIEINWSNGDGDWIDPHLGAICSLHGWEYRSAVGPFDIPFIDTNTRFDVIFEFEVNHSGDYIALSDIQITCISATQSPATALPTTSQPTTAQPTTPEPTTFEPTTPEPTTSEPTTVEPTTFEPTTDEPTTATPTTNQPSISSTNLETASPTFDPTDFGGQIVETTSEGEPTSDQKEETDKKDTDDPLPLLYIIIGSVIVALIALSVVIVALVYAKKKKLASTNIIAINDTGGNTKDIMNDDNTLKSPTSTDDLIEMQTNNENDESAEELFVNDTNETAGNITHGGINREDEHTANMEEEKDDEEMYMNIQQTIGMHIDTKGEETTGQV